MYRTGLILVLCALIVFAFSAPARASNHQVGTPALESQSSATLQDGGQVTDSSGGSTGNVGGIEPVSPAKISGKLQQLGDRLYGMASPLADMIAKLALAGAALLLLLVLILGAGILRRVVGACFGVALGLLLFYCAPQIVALIKYMAAWFGA